MKFSEAPESSKPSTITPLTKQGNIAGFKQEFALANTDDAATSSVLELSQGSSEAES